MDDFTFRDSKGREWSVRLTLATAERVDASDFSEIWEQPFSMVAPSDHFFEEVIVSPRMIFALIWAIIKPQADKAEISFEDWKDSLTGDIMREAKLSFWRALADFFPDHRTALSKWMETQREGMRRIDQETAKISPKILSHLDALIQRELKELGNELDERVGEKSI